MLLQPKLPVIDLKKEGGIATITIQNPPSNELSAPVLLRLGEVLLEVKNDDSIKAVVLTGEKVFSIGADVMEIYKLSQMNDPEKIRELLKRANDIVSALENLGKLTVAAINGFCLGGGNELVMACKYRIASEKSNFGQPEIKLGIIPGMGGTQRLPRLIGAERALPVLLTGEFFSAQEAEKIGLVDKVVPEIDLKSYILAFIKEKLDEKNDYKNYFPRRPWPHVIIVDKELMKNSVKMIRESKYPAASAAILESVSYDPTDPHGGLMKEQELFLEILKTEEAKQGIERDSSD